MNIKQRGFALVESLLILLILAVVGFGGYIVWHNQAGKIIPSPTSVSSSRTATNAANTYASWKSYTLVNERATFKYPSNWILTVPPPKSPHESDSDSVSLKAPDGFSVGINVNPNGGYGGDDSKILSADPITFIGQSDFLQYHSFPIDANTFTETIDSIQLSTSATEKYKFPTAKNNISNSSSYGPISEFYIYAFFATSKGVKTVAGNSDINNLKQIIESMNY